MRVVVHIGTHKTGTSSIQTFCAINRKALLEQGNYYPTNKYSSRNFNFLAARIARGDLDEPRAFLADAARKAARKGAHTVLLSAESFYAMNSFFFRLYNRPVDDYWTSEKNAIEAFRTCLPPGEMRILAYLRRQDLFLESVYNQCVKHETGFGGDIHEFHPAMEEMLDYDRQLSLWADAFGDENVTIRSYDDIANDLIPSFLECVGLQRGIVGKSSNTKERVNERFGRDVLEYKRILNRIDVPRAEAAMGMFALWRISEQLGDINAFQKFLAPGQRRELLARHKSGNDRVRCRFMPPRNEGLFKDPDPEMDETWTPYSGLSVERALEIYLRHQRITGTWSFRLELTLRRVAHFLRQKVPGFNSVLDFLQRLRSPRIGTSQ